MSLSLLGKYGTKKRRPSHNLSRPVLSPASALRSLSSVALSSVQASKTLSQNLSKIPESVNFLFDTLSGFYYESTNQLSSGFYFEATGRARVVKSTKGLETDDHRTNIVLHGS